MKKLLAVLSLLLVASMLFSIAMADEMSLEDMQKHTKASLACLADYNAVFDDKTYTALFYSKDMIGTYRDIDLYSSDWTEKEIDKLYLGFEAFAVEGYLAIVPCIICEKSLEIYFKADNNRFSIISTDGDVNIYNEKYFIGGDKAANYLTYRLSSTGYDMLKCVAAADAAFITDSHHARITLTAEDKQTIADFVADMESIGLNVLVLPSNTFFTCYTNWE